MLLKQKAQSTSAQTLRLHQKQSRQSSASYIRHISRKHVTFFFLKACDLIWSDNYWLKKKAALLVTVHVKGKARMCRSNLSFLNALTHSDTAEQVHLLYKEILRNLSKPGMQTDGSFSAIAVNDACYLQAEKINSRTLDVNVTAIRVKLTCMFFVFFYKTDEGSLCLTQQEFQTASADRFLRQRFYSWHECFCDEHQASLLNMQKGVKVHKHHTVIYNWTQCRYTYKLNCHLKYLCVQIT